MNNFTTTLIVSQSTFPVAVGYIAVLITVVLFGSNLVPVKKFETGNGLFYQWILCSAIWVVGLITYTIRACPTFNALAMLGGCLWSTGNILVVPIIKTIGLAQGILIWGSMGLLSGWASSRFGWFGTKPQLPYSFVLNYCGVSLCVISAFCYLFLRSRTSTNLLSERVIQSNDDEEDSTLHDNDDVVFEQPPTEPPSDSNDIFSRLSKIQKKVIGIGLSIFAGILFGFNFVPVTYQMDNDHTASKNGLDYVFPHFCGIYCTSSFFFLVYCVYSRNNPTIFPRAILPAYVAGLMWGVAQVGWFVANDVLSQPITFPIISTVPGIIGTLWGIFFKEIRGKYNFLVLAIAFTVAISGSVLTGLSKVDFHPNATLNHHHQNDTYN